MSDLVIDASVALKWYVPEADTSTALELLENDSFALHAPDFLKIEVANALWKHARLGHVPPDHWLAVQPELSRSIDRWHSAASVLDEASKLSTGLDHPIYDCIYLAIAAQIKAPLVSSDLRFLQKVAQGGFAGLVVPLVSWRNVLQST